MHDQPVITAVPGKEWRNETVSGQAGILSSQAPSQSTAVQEPWSVEQALQTFSIPTPSSPPTTPIPFLHLLSRLKTTPREGWRRKGVVPGESIADHMYRMAIMTQLAPPSLAARLDVGRCTRMALVHDMAEALVGDITPVDGVSKAEKSRRESTTMDYLTGRLLGATQAGVGSETGSAAESLRAVWEEYERSETLEAKFVHDVDKLELVLQMVEYERASEGKLDLGEFAHVARKVELREMKAWCTELLKEREEFWASMGKDASAVENSGIRKEIEETGKGVGDEI